MRRASRDTFGEETRVNYGNESRTGALLAPGADRNRVIVDREVKGKKGAKKRYPSGAHCPPTRSMIALLNNWDA